MKVSELRTALEKYTKADLIQIAAEFYKLIPKAKKEDNDLDALILNFSQAKEDKKSAPSEKVKLTPLPELAKEITLFIENAENQCYLYPNKIVSKKDRAGWRFKVRAWFKELANQKRVDADFEIQAKLLHNLYVLLQEGTHHYSYFTTQEPFNSIGIEENVFLHATLFFKSQATEPQTFVEEAIQLWLASSIYSDPQAVFFEFIDSDDLCTLAMEVAKKMLSENFNASQIAALKQKYDSSTYHKQEKNNHLVKLIFFCYIHLSEVEKAIDFFLESYINKDAEVVLYILVSNLLKIEEHDIVPQVIKNAQNKGITPRENLLTLYHRITVLGETPRHL